MTVATLPLPSASASPSSIVVAVRGGVATSRAPVSAASARSNHGARRTSVVSRAVDGGSLSSVSLGPSASSSSSSSAPASGGVGGSKATVVLPLDQVDLTSEVRLGSLGVLLSLIVVRGLSARSGSGRAIARPSIRYRTREKKLAAFFRSSPPSLDPLATFYLISYFFSTSSLNRAKKQKNATLSLSPSLSRPGSTGPSSATCSPRATSAPPTTSTARA